MDFGCHNLSFGLVIKARACKGAGQEKSPRVTYHAPGNVGEWKNEHSHSQMSSHFGNWSFDGLPNLQKIIVRGQNPLDWKFPYIIWNFLECKCLTWVRMTHLDTSNTSYGQKKGRESNWQFDSRPLKVKNRPYFLAFRRHATYSWKALDEGYNFALDLISIGGLHTKL
jgi:hypothetical protein